MQLPVSLFIGLRYLRGRSGDRFSRFVSLMSTCGITIGVMSLITVLSVMNGFENELKSRILGVLPQATITPTDAKSTQQSLPDSYLSQLPLVAKPQPISQTETIVQSRTQLAAGHLVGLGNDEIAALSGSMIAGRVSYVSEGEYRVILGHSLARQLNVRIGDQVRLMVTSASQFTPLGRMPSQRLFTVAAIFNTGSDIDAQLMFGHLRDVSKLTKYKKDSFGGWRLHFQDPFVVSELAQIPIPSGWQWNDWRDQRGELFQAVRMEKNMMGLMLGLIVAVAGFNIISALIMVVVEKRAEVAILKTQGMRDGQIVSVFVVQGATSGTLGALAGSLLGVALSLNLNSILDLLGVALFAAGSSLPIVINPQQIAFVTVAAILMSLLATLYPSYRAAQVQPAEALRYE